MGSHDFPLNLGKDLALPLSARVVVVVSTEHAQAFRSERWREALSGLRIIEAAPSDELPTNALNEAEVLVLEVAPDDRASMKRLAKVHARQPELPIVAALPDTSVALVRTLVRAGVADVVSLPLDFADLTETVLDVLAEGQRARQSETRLAPMIAVIRSIGGCGATSIATHLAAELAERTENPAGVAIADLDLQLGSVAEYLGRQGRGSIADLLEAADRLDDELLRSAAWHVDDKLAIFAAPDAILPLETVDTDDLLRVLTTMRGQYGAVVIDLPANWTSWSLSAVSAADLALVVVELSVASLRQAKRRIELFASVGIAPGKVAVVVNRVEKRLFRTIEFRDVAETLGVPVIGSIALDEPLVGSAQDQGLLVRQVQRKSRFQTDIAKLAAHLAERFHLGGR